MILSAQTIRRLCDPLNVANPMLTPFEERQQHERSGCSFGLSSAGYDIRIKQDIRISPGDPVVLASTLEHFHMPSHVLGVVHDKSTWARRGIAVQNTVIEPGWRGFLTLELTNHGSSIVSFKAGTPIAQVLFHLLDAATDQPYPEDGKYMDQPDRPVAALEKR